MILEFESCLYIVQSEIRIKKAYIGMQCDTALEVENVRVGKDTMGGMKAKEEKKGLVVVT